MCRHLAWLGAPRTLADLVLEGECSLLVQSYAPQEQRFGTVNADGFGAGWYVPTRAEPVRYRRAQPIWTDASFASLAGTVASGCVLAAVRSAGVGTPVEETATAPFTAGRWLFSHNGRVEDVAAARRLLPADRPEVESAVDSAVLWALVLHRLRAGEGMAGALAGVVTEVAGRAGGRLNLLATDGEQLVATRCGDTLYVNPCPDGVLVASEPTLQGDGARWTPVPDGCVVVAERAGLTITALDGVAAAGRRS